MTQNGARRLAAVTYGSTESATCGGPGAFEQLYAYSQGGLMTAKKLRITQNVFGVGLKSASLVATQEYNNEGQMTKQYYPTVWAGSPATMQPTPTYQFVYDSMARLYQIKETNPQQNYYHVAEVNYGVANEIGNIKYNNWSQTQHRYYNVRLQMTRITAPGMDIEYLYSPTQNNGQITGMKQWNGGSLVQQVAYTYDSLARLSNAQTTGGSVSWNPTFGMDGFGNLNSQTGAGPNWNQYTNPVNNRISSFTYDSNGNTTSTALYGGTTYEYDVENRLLQTTMPNGGGVERYGYGVGNQRVWRQKANGQYEYYFYKLNGERFGKYRVLGLGDGSDDIGFFLLEQESVVPKGMQMNRDRLGNVMYSANTVYYPYGEEYTVTANDKDKFATYHRDSTTGLDYAVNRYYSTQSARFLTADPYRASGGPAEPGSWNRYNYVGGDPANKADPSGLYSYDPYFDCIDSTWGNEAYCNGAISPSSMYSGLGTDTCYHPASQCYGQQIRDAGPGGGLANPARVDPIYRQSEGCTLAMQLADECDDATVSLATGLLARNGYTLAAAVAWQVYARVLGTAGERIVGNILNVTTNTSNRLLGTQSGIARIPDFFSRATRTIAEVKNTSSVSYTSQIRDMALWARSKGWSFQLWVNRGAELSAELKSAAAQGLIDLQYFNWP